MLVRPRPRPREMVFVDMSPSISSSFTKSNSRLYDTASDFASFWYDSYSFPEVISFFFSVRSLIVSSTLCCCIGSVTITSYILLCSIRSFASSTKFRFTSLAPISSAISPDVLRRSSAYRASPSSFAASAAQYESTPLDITPSLNDSCDLSFRISCSCAALYGGNTISRSRRLLFTLGLVTY